MLSSALGYSYTNTAAARSGTLSGNVSRLASMTYPDGSAVNYSYASGSGTAGIDDRISRLTAINLPSFAPGAQDLVKYQYVGSNWPSAVQYRWYDPTLGRWLQRDRLGAIVQPFFASDGSPNGYLYLLVRNNSPIIVYSDGLNTFSAFKAMPLSVSDPSGLLVCGGVSVGGMGMASWLGVGLSLGCQVCYDLWPAGFKTCCSVSGTVYLGIGLYIGTNAEVGGQVGKTPTSGRGTSIGAAAGGAKVVGIDGSVSTDGSSVGIGVGLDVPAIGAYAAGTVSISCTGCSPGVSAGALTAALSGAASCVKDQVAQAICNQILFEQQEEARKKRMEERDKQRRHARK